MKSSTNNAAVTIDELEGLTASDEGAVLALLADLESGRVTFEDLMLEAREALGELDEVCSVASELAMLETL